MRSHRLIALGWVALLVLSLWLRFDGLDSNPIHADEATGARILAQQLEGEPYRFNPKHFHGPLLSTSSSAIAGLRSETSWNELRLMTLRIGPALAGVLIVLTPLLWVRFLGHGGALTAGAFLASSPLLVYYNRLYIHESILCLLGMLALLAIFRLLTKPTLLAGTLAGLWIGLMFATKETFAISVIAWSLAGSLCLCTPQLRPTQTLRRYLGPLITLALIAFLASGYCYTHGFTHLAGLRDAYSTFFIYETTPGHEKEWYYYLHTLLWPKQTLGLWWTELSITLFALIALTGAFLKRDHAAISLLFIVLSALIHLLIYSLISYKTPWLMLLPWAHLCLAGGAAFAFVNKMTPVLRLCGLLALVSALAYQTTQSLYATGSYANDARNPYAYVPTTRDPQTFANWLQQIESLPDAPIMEPIGVIGSEYWPLPWYLRSFETIGYWPTPPDTIAQFPVVFAMPAQVAACDDLLEKSHIKLPRSLRSNVSISLYLRHDLWNLWMENPEP